MSKLESHHSRSHRAL